MRNMLAHEILDCILTGDLETIREGDTLILTIDTDHIFEAPVTAKLAITHELSTHNVTVSADGEGKLLITCLDVDDAVNVSDILARCLFVPIAD